MKLDKIQILEIFQLERIADDNTGVYNINFQDLLNKLSLPTEKKSYIKSLYENQNIYTEREHLNKVASLLDFQIEMFSDDFWEIFFFRKHAYLSSYKERKWNEFNESYESVKDVKKKVKVLKSLNISYSPAGAQEFGFTYPRIILFKTQDGRKGALKIKDMVKNGTSSYILCDIKVQKQ